MRNPITKVRSFVGWWLVISLSFSAMTAAARSMAEVLCVGADGHVEIEYADQGLCNDSSSRDPLNNLSDTDRTLASPSMHCGKCIDLQVNQKSGVVVKTVLVLQKTSADLPAVATRVTVGLPTDYALVPKLHLPRNLDPPPGSALARRTVVLLI